MRFLSLYDVLPCVTCLGWLSKAVREARGRSWLVLASGSLAAKGAVAQSTHMLFASL